MPSLQAVSDGCRGGMIDFLAGSEDPKYGITAEIWLLAVVEGEDYMGTKTSTDRHGKERCHRLAWEPKPLPA
jgi:hypothetical protein